VKSIYRIVLFGSTLLIAGCGPGELTRSSLGLERFGLTESPADHPLMASAIKDASKVLGDYSKIRFAEGWAQSSVDNAVKVFTSTSSGFGQSEIMATYQECGCVVAQSAALSRWLVAHLGTSEGLLSLDAKNLLAYMLLHEAGHVANGDAGRVLPRHTSAPKATSSSQGPLSTDVEEAADEFAANAIASALEQKGTDRGVAAAKLTVTLAQLSWNLSAHRLLDDFGGTGLNKPSLFRDAGLSHPNLEWRILVVNAAISKSETSRQLLEEFERRRTGDTGYRLFPR
jgi:hypothetical protein